MYTRSIAHALGLDEATCDLVYRAGILHDIGKIGTPDAILLKPSKLSNTERSMAEQHVSNGYTILSNIPMYHDLAPIVGAHHERWNGSGYPKHLVGETIPFLSRIMMLADSFDAMTSSRIYKPAKSVSQALSEIRSLSGVDYDPDLVSIACDVLEQVYTPDEFTQHPRDVLSIERLAYYFKDQITGSYGLNYMTFLAQHDPNHSRFTCACIFDLDGVESINTVSGRKTGDEILKEFADLLLLHYPDTLVFRPYGVRFVQLCPPGTCPINKSEQVNAEPFMLQNHLHARYQSHTLRDENGLQALYEALISEKL